MTLQRKIYFWVLAVIGSAIVSTSASAQGIQYCQGRVLGLGLYGDWGFGTNMSVNGLGGVEVISPFRPTAQEKEDFLWRTPSGVLTNPRKTYSYGAHLEFRWEDRSLNQWAIRINAKKSQVTWFLENNYPFAHSTISNWLAYYHGWYNFYQLGGSVERSWKWSSDQILFFYFRMGFGQNFMSRESLGLVSSVNGYNGLTSNNLYSLLDQGNGAVFESRILTTRSYYISPSIGLNWMVGPNRNWSFQLGVRYNHGIMPMAETEYSAYENQEQFSANALKRRGNLFAYSTSLTIPINSWCKRGSRSTRPAPQPSQNQRPTSPSTSPPQLSSRPTTQQPPSSASQPPKLYSNNPLTLTQGVVDPVHLILVLDASPEMLTSNNYRGFIDGIEALIHSMPPGSMISAVGYSGRPRYVLEAVPISNPDAVISKLRQEQSDSGLELYDGLKLAYAIGKRTAGPQLSTHAIILHNGDSLPRPGVNSLAAVHAAAPQPIPVSVYTFKMDGTASARLRELAQNGQGRLVDANSQPLYNELKQDLKLK